MSSSSSTSSIAVNSYPADAELNLGINCPICRDKLIDPVILYSIQYTDYDNQNNSLNYTIKKVCDHLHCRKCIEQWCDTKKQCSLDRKSFALYFSTTQKSESIFSEKLDRIKKPMQALARFGGEPSIGADKKKEAFIKNLTTTKKQSLFQKECGNLLRANLNDAIEFSKIFESFEEMPKDVLSSTVPFDFSEIKDITAKFLDSISIEDLITILRTKKFNEKFIRGFLFSSAIHYYRNENTSEKKRHLLKIISEIPNEKDSFEKYPLLANCYWKIASYSILRDKNSFEEAITEALNAVSHFENEIDKFTALAHISKLYEKNGNNDQALKLLNDAIEVYNKLLNNPSLFQKAKSNQLFRKKFEKLISKLDSRKKVLIAKIKERKTCISKKLICVITVATLTVFLLSLYVFYPRR